MSTTSTQLREFVARFPAYSTVVKDLLLAAANELDRHGGAAKRCAEIAREEAERYRLAVASEPKDSDVVAASSAAMACRRVADRIEGEVGT